MTNVRALRIDHLALGTRDVEAAAAFYVEALGFEIERREATGAWLRLGGQRLLLAQADRDAAPYPEPMAANDPWFQHFAIAVSDMAAAYARLASRDPTPISRDGPQRLPPSTGNVTAYKFRDPDGHPLELSHIPGSAAWAAVARARPDQVFLGIDHTAVAAPDLSGAIERLRDLGFAEGPRFLNTGPEQDALDGLGGVVLDIAVMTPPGGGPHIELLRYRQPPPRAPARLDPTAIAATRTVFLLDDGETLTRLLADL